MKDSIKTELDNITKRIDDNSEIVKRIKSGDKDLSLEELKKVLDIIKIKKDET